MTGKVWLFCDFDNTLMGTEQYYVPTLVARFNDLYAAQIGRTMSVEEFFENFQGRSREDLCAGLSQYFNIHVDYPLLFADREWKMMQYMQQKKVPIAPNLLNTLAALQQQNIICSIVTNSTAIRCLAAMRFAQDGRGEELARFFGTRVFESGDLQKPKPDVYLRAMQQVDADPAKSFAVEDSPTGARSALAAGLQTFGFTGYAEHPGKRRDELLGLGVVDCFGDWSDFPALLQNATA